MTLSFRSLLVGAALLAFAPGCGSTVERRSGDPAAHAADDADDAGEEDGDDRSRRPDPARPDTDHPDPDQPDPDQPDPSVQSSVCPSAVFSGGPEDAVAVTGSDTSASLVMRDGTVVALDLPTESAPAGETAYVGAIVGPDRIVVARGWSTFGDEPTAHVTVRWFDRRGTITDELITDDGLWPSYVGADGTTVFYRSLADWGYVVRLADGSLHDLDGEEVWGEPLASGWLRTFDSEAQRVAFIHPATQERLDLDSVGYPTTVDDGFLYVQQSEIGPVLVHATPSSTERTSLDALGGARLDTLYVQPVAHTSWALLSDYETQRAWRANWALGTVEPIAAPPPAGSELLEDSCGLAQPMVSSSGQIFSGLRTSGDGQPAIADVDGGWQTIGEPYAQPGTFNMVETAGTFVVSAGDANMSYCPILDWDEPASEAAIAVDNIQIVRPSDGTLRILEGVVAWMIQPSSDGGCLTYATASPDGMETHRSLMDVREGEPMEIEGTWFAWLP